MQALYGGASRQSRVLTCTAGSGNMTLDTGHAYDGLEHRLFRAIT